MTPTGSRSFTRSRSSSCRPTTSQHAEDPAGFPPSYTAGVSRALLFVISLCCALGGLASCGHAPPPEPVHADREWVLPRLEAAARAASSCVRTEPERVVEVELGLSGVVRGRVLPYDPTGGETTACVEGHARAVPRQPAAEVVRALFQGDGTRLDPQSPRGRALGLRSRVAEQAEAVQRCALQWASRHPKSKGRVGLHLVISAQGRVTQAEVAASTLDDSANQCVLNAARVLVLPPIPGEYRFSYLFVGELAFLGAPDIDPVDPVELAQAVDRIRPDLGPCFAAYRTPGAVIIRVKFGNDGVPLSVAVEHGTAGGVQEDDLAADGCVRTVAWQVRVLPFDGPPVERHIPFSLR